MADLTPTVAVEVQLAGGGGAWTDLAADLVGAAGLEIRRGIRGSGPNDLVASVGTATFTLRNDARTGKPLGYYSLWNANKRTGWDLGIGCRVRLTDPATATVRTVFTGKIDRITSVPGRYLDRRVEVVAVDWMQVAEAWTLTAAVGEQADVSGDQVLTNILAEMPTQPDATSFDVWSEVYPVALDDSRTGDTPAITAFGRLAASERGFIYVKADGTLRAERRHTRPLNTTSSWTLNDSVLLADTSALGLVSSRDEILNTVRVTVHDKQIDLEPTTEVYRQTNEIRINAGETQLLIGSFEDPDTGEQIGAVDVQPQVLGTDVIFTSLPDGNGSDLTGDLTITLSLTTSGVRFDLENTGATDGYLSRNRLYGRAVRPRGAVTAEASDSASIASYGEHVGAFDLPYQHEIALGQAAAEYILAQYGDPSAIVRSVTVMGTSSAALTQILQRDISDRLTVTETVTGVNDDFFINGVDLRVLPSGHVVATYTLAPAIDPAGGTYWILGTSTLGTSTIPASF